MLVNVQTEPRVEASLFVLLSFRTPFVFLEPKKKREILDDVKLMGVAWVVCTLLFSACLHMILFESRAFVCEAHTYFIIIKNCSNNNVKKMLYCVIETKTRNNVYIWQICTRKCIMYT